MREITSHRVNPANDKIEIQVLDQPGAGGASHEYRIGIPLTDPVLFPEFEWTPISFQNGPIVEAGINGVTHEALLAIVIDRLQSFQRGRFSCRENALAITKLEEAVFWLNQRTKARMAEGVEGTHELRKNESGQKLDAEIVVGADLNPAGIQAKIDAERCARREAYVAEGRAKRDALAAATSEEEQATVYEQAMEVLHGPNGDADAKPFPAPWVEADAEKSEPEAGVDHPDAD